MNQEIENQIKVNHKLIGQRLRKVGLVAFIVILLTVLFVILVSRKASEIESTNQAVFKLQELKIKKQHESKLLDQYEERDEELRRLFPNEREIADFIKRVRQTASLSSSEVKFNFDTDKPRRDKNQYAFISYSLHLKTDLNGLLVFLDRFERLPYMTIIRLIQGQDLANFDALGTYLIKADVYVAEPFSVQN